MWVIEFDLTRTKLLSYKVTSTLIRIIHFQPSIAAVLFYRLSFSFFRNNVDGKCRGIA